MIGGSYMSLETIHRLDPIFTCYFSWHLYTWGLSLKVICTKATLNKLGTILTYSPNPSMLQTSAKLRPLEFLLRLPSPGSVLSSISIVAIFFLKCPQPHMTNTNMYPQCHKILFGFLRNFPSIIPPSLKRKKDETYVNSLPS